MRIAQVINLVDDRGSYGGPLRVGLNQVDELRRRGHDVTLLAGGRGYSGRPRPPAYAGTELTLYPARQVLPRAGFAGSFAPGIAAHLTRRALGPRDQRYDVVHIHLGRDLTTLPAAAAALATGTPYVVQTHGMIDDSSRALARPLDALLTRRVLAGAAEVLLLTDRDENDVAQVMRGQGWRARRLPNGVVAEVVSSIETKPPSARPEVLYLGRLHERKRPLAFVEIGRRAVELGVDADFVLVGADEGELAGVRAAIAALPAGAAVRYDGPLPMEQSLARLARADVMVLPSDSDTFPMALLEAMSVGVPVVCMRSCGLAGDVESAGAGFVVPDGDPDAAARAVARLVADASLREQMGRAGRVLVSTRFSIAAIGQELEAIYVRAAGAERGRPSRQQGPARV